MFLKFHEFSLFFCGCNEAQKIDVKISQLLMKKINKIVQNFDSRSRRVEKIEKVSVARARIKKKTSVAAARITIFNYTNFSNENQTIFFVDHTS